jgi:hypothetical protein
MEPTLNILSQGLSSVVQDMHRLAQLGEAQVRFPEGRRSCDSTSERLRTGSQVGRRRLSALADLGETIIAGGSRVLAAPRQGAQRQNSCRQGQYQQRRR